jgi:hypothetical protein
MGGADIGGGFRASTGFYEAVIHSYQVVSELYVLGLIGRLLERPIIVPRQLFPLVKGAPCCTYTLTKLRDLSGPSRISAGPPRSLLLAMCRRVAARLAPE